MRKTVATLVSVVCALGAGAPAAHACVADLDADGGTLLSDLALFAAAFGQNVAPGSGADFDGDGVVALGDFGVFAADFGCVEEPFACAASSPGGAPSGLGAPSRGFAFDAGASLDPGLSIAYTDRGVTTYGPDGAAVAPDQPRWGPTTAVASPIVGLEEIETGITTVAASGFGADRTTRMTCWWATQGGEFRVARTPGALDAFIAGGTPAPGTFASTDTSFPSGPPSLLTPAAAASGYDPDWRHTPTAASVVFGTIVVACAASRFEDGAWAEVGTSFVYSDDAGATWRLLGVDVGPAESDGEGRGKQFQMYAYWELDRDPGTSRVWVCAANYIRQTTTGGARWYLFPLDRDGATGVWRPDAPLLLHDYSVATATGEHAHAGVPFRHGADGIAAYLIQGDVEHAAVWYTRLADGFGEDDYRLGAVAVDAPGYGVSFPVYRDATSWTAPVEVHGTATRWQGLAGETGPTVRTEYLGNQGVAACPGADPREAIIGTDTPSEFLWTLRHDPDAPTIDGARFERVAGHAGIAFSTALSFYCACDRPEAPTSWLASVEPPFNKLGPEVRTLVSDDGVNWAVAVTGRGFDVHAGDAAIRFGTGGMDRAPLGAGVTSVRPLAVGPGGVNLLSGANDWTGGPDHTVTNGVAPGADAPPGTDPWGATITWIDVDGAPAADPTVARVRASLEGVASPGAPVLHARWWARPRTVALGAPVEAGICVSAALEVGPAADDTPRRPRAYGSSLWTPIDMVEPPAAWPGGGDGPLEAIDLVLGGTCGGAGPRPQHLEIAPGWYVEGTHPGYPLPFGGAGAVESATIDGLALPDGDWTVVLVGAVPEDGWDQTALRLDDTFEAYPLFSLVGGAGADRDRLTVSARERDEIGVAFREDGADREVVRAVASEPGRWERGQVVWLGVRRRGTCVSVFCAIGATFPDEAGWVEAADADAFAPDRLVFGSVFPDGSPETAAYLHWVGGRAYDAALTWDDVREVAAQRAWGPVASP